jgi:hypothetical protein
MNPLSTTWEADMEKEGSFFQSVQGTFSCYKICYNAAGMFVRSLARGKSIGDPAHHTRK